MNKDCQLIFEVYLKESVSNSFLKFYKTIGRGDYFRSHIPNNAILWDCLTFLIKHYKDSIDFFESKSPEIASDGGRRPKMLDEYRQRYKELTNALNSDDPQKKVLAIDNAINQLHHNGPMITQFLNREHNTEKDEQNWEEIIDLLDKLGRLGIVTGNSSLPNNSEISN